jgi:hypothetical protein
MAPRSRRDKVMSDYKAIKKTYQGFQAEKFSISPRKRVFSLSSVKISLKAYKSAGFTG